MTGAPAPATPPRASVLVIDDDADYARMLERLLASEGYEASHATGTRAGLAALEKRRADVVLTDMKMPDGSGLDVLRAVRAKHPGTEVLVMSGYRTIEATVEAMKLGAADFLPKPFETDELLHRLSQVARVRALEREVARLQGELESRHGVRGIVGGSAAMERLLARVAAAARTPSSVLISGESGTGKELVARAIHAGGDRAKGPFTPINCAALPRELIESELFGHAKGAFTNALTEHEGLFRAAKGGTLFLDEISEMPVETQAKLLRALEEGRVRPVGAVEEVAVDARIVAATNRDPQEAVKAGKLREDLYYRIAVISIEVPPLRERPEDIPLLVTHFVEQFNQRFGKRLRGLSPEAARALTKYAWPGNIRELRNAVEGAFALARGPEIGLEDLPRKLLPAGGAAGREEPGGQTAAAGTRGAGIGAEPSTEGVPGQEFPALETALQDLEKSLILRALAATQGNKSRAADLLQVSRKRIYRKLEEWGIPVEDAGRGEDGE